MKSRTPLSINQSIIINTQVAFWAGQEEENKLKVICDHSKHPFFDFTQVAFSAGHEAENEIKVTCEPMKQRFLDLNQVAFWDGPEAEN